MKNPKLIDEAWIDELINERRRHFGVTGLHMFKEEAELLEKIKSELKPVIDITSRFKQQPSPAKTNVEKIRAGEMAIENDDKEALKKCCKFLFFDWRTVAGSFKYYCAYHDNKSLWKGDDSTDLPTIKASELIKEIEGVTEPAPVFRPLTRKEQDVLIGYILYTLANQVPCGLTPEFVNRFETDNSFIDQHLIDELDINNLIEGAIGAAKHKEEFYPEPAEWQPKFGDKITVNSCGNMIDAVCVGDKDGAIYWKSEINFNKDEFGVQNIKHVKPRTPTLTLAEAEQLKSRIEELKAELAEAEAKLGVKIIT